jgi:hypothetical protein
MQSQAAVSPSNPIARAASAVPYSAALALSIVARLAGAAAAIYYTVDQESLFLDERFNHPWVFTVVVAVLAVASIAVLPGWDPKVAGAWGRRVVVALGSFGCGVVLFGGATLSHRPAGVAVLVFGIVAAASYAAAAHQRRASGFWLAAGFFLAAFFLLALTGFIGIAIEN